MVKDILLSYGDYDSFAKTLSFDKKQLEGCLFDVPYLKCPKKQNKRLGKRNVVENE